MWLCRTPSPLGQHTCPRFLHRSWHSHCEDPTEATPTGHREAILSGDCLVLQPTEQEPVLTPSGTGQEVPGLRGKALWSHSMSLQDQGTPWLGPVLLDAGTRHWMGRKALT